MTHAAQPASGEASAADALKTPLYDEHVALGARMVPFAGYLMPVQYAGIIAEHQHTREKAGVFDVSHMGQAFLVGPDHATIARALEALVPADILNLAPGRQRYTQFLNAEGGVLDDLMVHRSADPADDGRLALVVNAACKDADFAHLQANLPAAVRLEPVPTRALLALQGPESAAVMTRLGADVADWPFMSAARPPSPASLPTSRAPATPARTATRSRSPPTPSSPSGVRSSPIPPSRPSASAPAIRSVSKAASASTATISTRRPRRSRPICSGRSRSVGGRKAAFPAPRSSSARSRRVRSACASASVPRAAPPPARAPRSACRAARRSAPSHRAASVPPSADPWRWATSPPAIRRPAPASNSSFAARACRRRSSRCPSCQPASTAAVEAPSQPAPENSGLTAS